MATILWIIAAILVIAGIVQILQGEIILGVVLIVVGLLVGPGGVSIFGSIPALAAAWPMRLTRVGQTLDGRPAPDLRPAPARRAQ